MNVDGRVVTDEPVLRPPVGVTLDEAHAWFEREGRRFIELVRAIPDGSRPAQGLRWTVAETAVHVLDVLRHYREGVLGNLTPHVPRVPNVPAYVAAKNDEAIRAEPERRPHALAELLERALDDLGAATRDLGASGVVTMDAGHRLSVPAMLCGHIGEFLIHGYDIARSIDVPWPIEHRAAVLAVHGTSAALTLAFKPDAARDLDLNVHVRLRHGDRFAIRVARGEVWSEVPQGRPDLVISADPAAYLFIGFGRLSVPAAVSKGKIFAWGRRPWVVATLPNLFLNP